MPAKHDWDVAALAAAYFRSQGQKQVDIARQLRKGQPEVSRLLKHALKQGWLDDLPRLVREKVPNEVWKQMEQAFLSFHHLQDKVSAWAPKGVACRVHVIPAKGDDFYRQAARHVAGILQRSAVIGITYGRTLARMIRALPEFKDRLGRRSVKFRVVPLCGEPLHLINVERSERYSSTLLAHDLQVIIGGQQRWFMPSLIGVPVYIPSIYSRAENGAIRNYIERVPGYKEIFLPRDGQNERPLINTVDTLLTGVGIVSHDPGRTGTFIRERLKQEDEPHKTALESAVDGDIGGVLVPKRNLDNKTSEYKLVQDMNRGWVGLHEEHIKQCASQAKEPKSPGVVIIASSMEKAVLIRNVVERGLANVLLIDKSLATALEALP
jgi:hypothetical protein